MCPISEQQDPVLRSNSGSGELELEMAISKLRTAILRAVNELDILCVSVREARVRVEAIDQLTAALRPQNDK